MNYHFILVTLDSISKVYRVWASDRDQAEVFALKKFTEELESWGFEITKHYGQVVARVAREKFKGEFFNLPAYLASPRGAQDALGWLRTLPGWRAADGDYRRQSWLRMPDGRFLRVMSGGEPDEPDLITDIIDWP